MMDLITQRLKLRDVIPNIEARYPSYASKIKEAYGDEEVPFLRRAFLPKDLEFHPSENAIVGVINSITKDWYDEVVMPEGIVLDLYSGIVLWNHDYFREAAPHAKNQWVKPNNKQNPTHLLAKTEYITKSALGQEIWDYREGENPLGQSIGFIPLKWLTKDDDNWQDAYESWRERILTWRAEQGIPKSRIDTSEPYKIYTKWVLLEYSDVYLPANPDAVAVAVNRGWINEADAEKYMLEDSELTMDGSKAVRFLPGLQGEPYKNEHSCRLEEPNFDEYARENCKAEVDNKCLDFIYGIRNDKSVLQAYRYRKSEGWTASAAKTHCDKHNGMFEAAAEEDSLELGEAASEMQDPLASIDTKSLQSIFDHSSNDRKKSTPKFGVEKFLADLGEDVDEY